MTVPEKVMVIIIFINGLFKSAELRNYVLCTLVVVYSMLMKLGFIFLISKSNLLQMKDFLLNYF